VLLQAPTSLRHAELPTFGRVRRRPVQVADPAHAAGSSKQAFSRSACKVASTYLVGHCVAWRYHNRRQQQTREIELRRAVDSALSSAPMQNQYASKPLSLPLDMERARMTVKRVATWSLASMLTAFICYPVCQRIAWWVIVGVRAPIPLSGAAENFIGNFLALTSLLFSILAGNSYSSLYSQNESIFYALFAEVSEAKALMEQVALVCSGRPFYKTVLEYINNYVMLDLRRLDRQPAVLLARKPRDDPLESILYLTSVGVPSIVYETVRSLRQTRGQRLGAVQRKLPGIQIALLYVLGMLNVVTFLLFGASCTACPEMRLCRVLFTLLVGAVVMTMRVIHELWQTTGGAYNVDGVLAVMVRGLEEELKQRLQGKAFSDTRLPSPPPRWQETGGTASSEDAASKDSTATQARAPA